MTTLYDKITDELRDGTDNARLKGLITERQKKWFDDRLDDLVVEFEEMQEEVEEAVESIEKPYLNNIDPEMLSDFIHGSEEIIL
jgi:hypothetical protein